MNTISIVIPVYNEKNTICTIIDKVQSSDTLGLTKQIVLVDDYSTDGSRDILKSFQDKQDFVVAYQEVNQGKGAALQKGFSVATGDIVLTQDADLEYSPDDYPKLLQPLVDGRADVVYGSRFISPDAHRVLYFWHFVANKCLTILSNIFTNLNLTDMETCYKVFKRETLQKVTLEQKRFGIEPEMTAKISQIPNVRIFEVGIGYNGRTYEEGKKIGLKDAFQALFCIVKYNMSARTIAMLVILTIVGLALFPFVLAGGLLVLLGKK